MGLSLGFALAEGIGRWYVAKARLVEKIGWMEERVSSRRGGEVNAPDPLLGWSLQPRSSVRVTTSEFDVEYSINSYGFRDAEPSLEKREGEYRIIALGESNVFGEGIEYGKRLTEIIERDLRPVNVINMGVPGFGLDQTLLQLQRDVFKFHPDMVAVFILVEDYVMRCRKANPFGIPKPRFVLNGARDGLLLLQAPIPEEAQRGDAGEGSRPQAEAGSAGLSKKSALLTILEYNKRAADFKRDLAVKDRAFWEEVNACYLSDGPRGGGVVSEEDLKRLVFLILKECKSACAAGKAEFLVVYNSEHGRLDYIGDLCGSLGIPSLDLTAVLASAASAAPLRFQIDPHYNEYAHAVIGERLVRYFREEYPLRKTIHGED